MEFLAKAKRALAGRSSGEIVRLIAKNVSYAVYRLTPAARRARARDAAFDREWGTETSGRREVSALRFSRELAREAVRYEASDAGQLARIIDALAIDFPATTFIDYGCGKGRPVLAAALKPFRRVVGIELSRELLEIAARNLEIVRAKASRLAPVEFVKIDAGTYLPPAGDLVCYLYNPFGSAVLSRVVANLEGAIAAAPRRVHVIYVDPRHPELFGAKTWTRKDVSGAAVFENRQGASVLG